MDCISLLPLFAWGRGGGLAGPLSAAVARPIHDDLVAVVRKPIEGALCEDRIIEERDPLFDGTVGGDDR